jgi:hypothetical protein
MKDVLQDCEVELCDVMQVGGARQKQGRLQFARRGLQYWHIIMLVNAVLS